MSPGGEAKTGQSKPSQAFIDHLQQCVKRQPDGQNEIDFDRVVAAVAADLPGARGYIDLACREALTAPGLLAPAALVADAYRHATGDDTHIGRVEECKRAVRAAGEPEHPLRRGPP
jgi:hypothetical protein